MKFHPGHYAQLKAATQPAEVAFAITPGIVGQLVLIPWKSLETEKNVFTFDLIDAYLAGYAEKYGRQLVVMIGDRDFKNPANKSRIVPSWLPSVPFNKKQEGGCVAKLWLPEVTERRALLLAELVKRYDSHPRLEAFVLQETALGGVNAKDNPDYTHERYINELLWLYEAWTGKQTMLWQAVNWLGSDMANIETLLNALIGIGGALVPDTVPWDDKPIYEVLAKYSDKLPVAMGGDTSQLLDPANNDKYRTLEELAGLQNGLAQRIGAQYQFWSNTFTPNATDDARYSAEWRQVAIGGVNKPLNPKNPFVSIESPLLAWFEEMQVLLNKGKTLLGG